MQRGDHVHRTRSVVAAVVGVVLMAGLTACGGESGGSGGGKDGNGGQSLSPLAALRQASARTEQQHSAKVEGTTVQGTPKGDQRSEMEGVMDWSGGGTTGDMTVTQSGGLLAGTPMDGKASPTRYTPDAMYVNMGDAFAASAGGGAHWIEYDYDVLAERGGPSGAFIKDQMQNNNPARSVQLLLAAGKVSKVGEESVRGKQTTHYRGTVDVAELTRMQSKDLSEGELKDLQDQMKASGMTTETIDLWIDGDDLLVKKEETAKSSLGDQGGFHSVVYYGDYGTPVTVEAPAAGDTVGFDEIG
jgi:hypothetical protein